MRNKRPLTLLILPLILFLVSSQLGAVNTSHGINQTSTEIGTISASLDADIQSLMGVGDIPSLHCGIVIQDRLVWAKGYGDQPNLDTVYMIASITKSFTATAFLQLMEQGLIDLDVDINMYLTFSVRNPDYPATPVTIRQLLSHTSGLARENGLHLFDNQLINWMNYHFDEGIPLWASPPALDEVITPTSMANAALWESQPGSTYSYSNLAFILLSYIFEEISGQSIGSYVQEHILDPLGMTGSGSPASAFLGRLAIGHERVNVTTISTLPHYDLYYWGGGQLRSTVTDLASYMIAHMNQGRCGDIQLLQPSSVELMHQPVTPSYALGWFINNDAISHNGGTFGYVTDINFRETASGSYGIILLINRCFIFVPDNAIISSREAIHRLLFAEAERLFTQTLVSAGLPAILVIGSLSACIAIIVIYVVIKRRIPR